MKALKIVITHTNCYSQQYVNVGDVVIVEGHTVQGNPFIKSKHKNNEGHEVVFVIGVDCEVVQ
jgi:hypothetical protein